MKRAHRRWILGVTVLALIVTGATIAVGATRRHDAPPPTSNALTPPGLPAQELLSSPMRKAPVPGWKTSSKELGLPPGAVPKLLGNVGDRGYFLGITGTDWWLVGIDMGSGRRLFAPVELGRSENALAQGCFINGPAMVLCAREDSDPGQPTRAWVVDTERGAIVYDGPTELSVRRTGDRPNLQQVGDYAVATVTGEGIHGVGPHAELTWFVAGGGAVAQPENWNRDAAPQRLAVQDGAGNSTADVVFSVTDGTVVNPELPQGGRFGRAVGFPGGFGYEYSATGSYFSDRVAFFDDSGRELSRPEFEGTLLTGSLDVPMVETASQDVVLTLDGRKLLELPKSTPMPKTRRIGARFFVAGDANERSWRQYDLRNGASGKTCEIESLGYSYLASDGEVAVLSSNHTAALGYDLVNCAELWSLPDSAQDVWRVNTSLIQRTDDQLFSLVAPS